MRKPQDVDCLIGYLKDNMPELRSVMPVDRRARAVTRYSAVVESGGHKKLDKKEFAYLCVCAWTICDSYKAHCHAKAVLERTVIPALNAEFNKRKRIENGHLSIRQLGFDLPDKYRVLVKCTGCGRETDMKLVDFNKGVSCPSCDKDELGVSHNFEIAGIKDCKDSFVELVIGVKRR